MMRRLGLSPIAFRSALCALVLLFGSMPMARAFPADSESRAIPQGSGAPRLVVLVIVDGLGYDYLTRHMSLLGKDGFRRLLDQGANFVDARYPFTGTRTATGHASLATGALPSVHGIIANGFFDRTVGDEVDFESDASVKIVGRPAGVPDAPGVSPERLIGSTFADELREGTARRARVVSLSVKARAAAMLGGRRPNGVYWMDEESGKVVTSTYYRQDLPAWVAGINTRMDPDKQFGMTWDRLMPKATYDQFGLDDQPGEEPLHGTRVFPHKITGGLQTPGPDFYDALTNGPYGNQLLTELALASLDGEQLGADDVPDLLAVSFSGHDNAGHPFGPDSHEVLDLFLRLDQQLATIFSALDKRLRDRYAVLLTADHGLTPLVEVSRASGFKAERIHPDALSAVVETRLDTEFGVGDWVRYFDDENLYLNRELAAQLNAPFDKVCRSAGEALMAVEGIEAYITAQDRIMAAASGDARLTALASWFNPKRSGDVVILVTRFSLMRDDPDGTAHGSSYSFDAHVPLIAYRCGIPVGTWRHSVTPLDVAPTLSALCGVGVPSDCQGHPLSAR
jgi:predicted AlkP superfamily pyrophosphatase or phosphodiesterase